MAPSTLMGTAPELNLKHTAGQMVLRVWSEGQWKSRPRHTASAGVKAVTPRPDLTHLISSIRNTGLHHSWPSWGAGKPSRTPRPWPLAQGISLTQHSFQYLGEVQRQAWLWTSTWVLLPSRCLYPQRQQIRTLLWYHK